MGANEIFGLLQIDVSVDGDHTVISADEPAPDIVIPKMKHDFGDVFEREKYEYSFVVRNRGEAELQIENVKPG